MFRKHRLEALSDGIFAIAMTLLVLEFKLPDHKDVVPGHLWVELRKQSSAFFCYAITFGITARYWVLQHMVFELVENVRKQAVLFTFAFLFLICLLPFTTPLMATFGHEPVALFLYALNQAAIGAALAAKLEFVRVSDKLPNSPEMTGLRVKLWTLTAAMAVGGVMGFVVPTQYAFLPSVVMIFLGQRVSKRFKPAAAALSHHDAN